MRTATRLPTQLDIDRFWSHVKKRRGCWLWMGARCNGYGVAWWCGQQARAHRIAYTLTYGAILPGLIVRHAQCANRACCRPGHLAVGTPKDNTDDMVRAFRICPVCQQPMGLDSYRVRHDVCAKPFHANAARYRDAVERRRAAEIAAHNPRYGPRRPPHPAAAPAPEEV